MKLLSDSDITFNLRLHDYFAKLQKKKLVLPQEKATFLNFAVINL